MVLGFFAELLHQIGVPEVEERLLASIENELARSAASSLDAHVEGSQAGAVPAATADEA